MASIFQHFRKLDFTKSLLRPIQCSVVGLRTINDPVVINNHQASEQLCFDDGRELFTSKTTRDILRSIFVLKLCSYDAVAKNSMVLMSSGRKLLGQTLFEFVMHKTVYGQFVAGETLPNIQQNIKELRECGIGTMLFVPTEEDISPDYCDFKSREDMFDKNAAAICECIARAVSFKLYASGPTEVEGFSQMKITALCSPMLLNELNQHLAPYQTSAEKPEELDVEFFARGYSEKIKLSVLTDNQNEHLCNVFKRLDSLAKECVKRNVNMVIDAEQTYLQAAINHLVLTLQYKYNKEYPWVYNTYQCYRKDTYDVLKADLEVMDKLGYWFGGKVVRGAYMKAERTRAAEMGYDDPIHNCYEDTNNMYNKVIDTLLHRVKHMSAHVMVASHNEESVSLAIHRMRELGIEHQDSKVSFGQSYGMCDQISYMLGQQGYHVYKSMPYGPVEHVLAYLARRANENRDVLKRTEKERDLLWQELKRRIGLAQ